MPEEKTMTITVKMPEGQKDLKAVLREPLFNEFRMAAMALNAESGSDYLAAGRQFIKYCWVGGDEKLKNADDTKDPDLNKAFAAACMDAYNEFFVTYETEVKKNY